VAEDLGVVQPHIRAQCKSWFSDAVVRVLHYLVWFCINQKPIQCSVFHTPSISKTFACRFVVNWCFHVLFQLDATLNCISKYRIYYF